MTSWDIEILYEKKQRENMREMIPHDIQMYK